MAAGAGNTQIINGKSYVLYSPEWYAARDAAKIQQAGVAGTAAGTSVKNAQTAIGGTTTAGGGGPLPPQIPPYGSGPQPGPGFNGGTAGGAGTGTGAGVAPGTVQSAQNEAEIAAMNRAKDRAGLMARGALTGLRSALGERGLLGGPSGIEGAATAQVANEGIQQMSDVNREQAVQAAQAARAREALHTTAGLTARGQDITQRGQDIQAQLQQQGFGLTQQQILQNAILNALRGQALY